MKPPCEVVVKRILPAIRSVLVKDLTERHKLSQTKIASRLGITQPAVSQYLGSPRGSKKLKENLEDSGLFSEVKALSDKIANGSTRKTEVIKNYCEICNNMGKEGTLCIYHLKREPYLEEEKCDLCLKGAIGDCLVNR